MLERGEILADEFPELQRAREMFVKLFANDRPFSFLGYTPQQKAIAQRVARLVEEGGEICQIGRVNPYLLFTTPASSDMVNIWTLTPKALYHMVATVDPYDSLRGTGFDGLLVAIFTRVEDPVFEGDTAVLDVCLYEENRREYKDLDFLVRAFYEQFYFTEARVQKRNALTVIEERLGLVAPYEAAWVDPETRLEFVVKMKVPEETFPTFHRWRRLPRVEYESKEYIPFGRRPNTSKETVMSVLERQREQVITGQFVLQPQSVDYAS